MSILFKKNSRNIPDNEDVEKAIQNWNPPKVHIHDIYKRRGLFESNKNYVIKTTEKRVIIQGEYQDLQLHDRSIIQRYEGNYNSLHMGFVQVALKPLTINGMNNSVLVALRDCRHLIFSNSRLAMAEFSLNNGPVYFNCYPSYQVSMADPHILKTLTLNLNINGYNSEIRQCSRDIEVAYKVYYMLLSNNLSPKEKKSLEVDYTTFIETNVASDNVAVERTIAWDSVEAPERWSVPLQQ